LNIQDIPPPAISPLSAEIITSQFISFSYL
jgi:hypothetical protein